MSFENKFAIMKSRLENHSNDLLILKKNVGSLEDTKVDVKKADQKHKKLLEELDEMKKEIALSENHLITVESFVDKYLPLRVQAQISELIGAIVEKKSEMHKKLLEYEKNRFDELYEEILADDGIPNVMGKI